MTLSTAFWQAAIADLRVIKPDPILVIGANTPVGQWATLKIMERKINIRIFTSDFDGAELTFGRDGTNADIYYGSLDDLVINHS